MASNNLFDFSVVLIDAQGLIRCVISVHICSHSRQSLNQISTNVSVLVWMLDLVDLGDEGSPAQRVCVCLSAVTVFLIFCVILVFTWKHIQIWCESLYVQRRLLAVCVSVTRAGCGGYLVRLLIQTTVHHFHSQRRSVLVCDITGQVAPKCWRFNILPNIPAAASQLFETYIISWKENIGVTDMDISLI